MTRRDDMVFTPDAGPQQRAAAMTQAREERQLARAKKHGGGLRRLAVAQRLKRRRRKAGRVRRSARIGYARAFAGRAVGAAGARIAARAAMINPLTAIFAVLAVAGAAAYRIATDTPIEGTGAAINKAVLGDMDDEARAKMATRDQLLADPEIKSIMGARKEQGLDGLGSQMGTIADHLFEMNRRYEVGKSRIHEALPVNSLFDMLVLNAVKAFKGSWEASGGDDAVAEFREKLKTLQTDSYIPGLTDKGMGGGR